MGPGGFPSLQNWRDLTPSGWVGSIPTRSRQGRDAAPGSQPPAVSSNRWRAPRAGARRPRCTTLALRLALGTALGAVAVPLPAQRADSVRAGVSAPTQRRAAAQPERGPPVSPRGAFLRSLLVPGWGQLALDRGLAGAIFVGMEMLSIAMTIKSKHDLDVAERFARDSIIESYTDSSGVRVPVRAPSPFEEKVRPRRQHYEDWIALLVFNHLLAGADAYIGAQLWDVPGKVTIRARPGGATLAARVAW
jgi:hypothetical protein